ncbi:aminoacyl-tRNA hydrolase [Candidatus Foliamicus sp.]
MTSPAAKIERPPELIVGLGNPGARHRSNRHNAGYTFIDRLTEQSQVQSMGIQPRLGAFGVLVFWQEVKLLLVKPLNYMNNSGDVVRKVLKFRRQEPGKMLVVHDDLDLPPGTARLKYGGGHGGHNGLRDVIEHCGADFLRLRLGVGRPPGAADMTRYVLSPPTPDEALALDSAMDSALKALSVLYANGLQAAMNELHTPTLH